VVWMLRPYYNGMKGKVQNPSELRLAFVHYVLSSLHRTGRFLFNDRQWIVVASYSDLEPG
jgi:hypothetical protein